MIDNEFLFFSFLVIVGVSQRTSSVEGEKENDGQLRWRADIDGECVYLPTYTDTYDITRRDTLFR